MAPIPAPALTVKLGRQAVGLVLSGIEQEASALGYHVGGCAPVGKTVVCSFYMRMRNGQTCAGRVQVRSFNGDLQRRFVGVVCK